MESDTGEMRLRLYSAEKDAETVSGWFSDDERTYTLWCARKCGYPVTQAALNALVTSVKASLGSITYVMTGADDVAAGFFSYAHDEESGTGFIRFVAVSPLLRGRGLGRTMIRLALKNAREQFHDAAVQLNVYDVNKAAVSCYADCGFTVRSTKSEPFCFKEERWGCMNMWQEFHD